MPPRLRRPKNLHISRELALFATIGSVIVGVSVLAVTMVIYGLNDRTTPIVASLAGLFPLIVNTLLSSLKSTEAADTAAKTHETAEFTASQNAAIQMMMLTHCGKLCSHPDCPFRKLPVPGEA